MNITNLFGGLKISVRTVVTIKIAVIGLHNAFSNAAFVCRRIARSDPVRICNRPQLSVMGEEV